MLRFIPAPAVLMAMCLSAAAATAPATPPAPAPTTWYVAQNVKTMNCIVTPTKPNGTTYMMVGMQTFMTVAAATKDMRAEAACKTASAHATTTPATTPPKSTT